MDLDAGAVERDRLKLDAHDLFALQVFEYPIEDPVLGPAIHAGIDRVPSAEATRQAPPLAAMLGDIQDGVEHLEIRNPYVATLHGQVARDAGVLRFSDFHPPMIRNLDSLV